MYNVLCKKKRRFTRLALAFRWMNERIVYRFVETWKGQLDILSLTLTFLLAKQMPQLVSFRLEVGPQTPFSIELVVIYTCTLY